MKSVAVVVLGMLVAVQGLAQSHRWERTNPGGGGVFTVVGGSMNGVVVAGSDLSGAYRSTDGGKSWDVIGASRGLTETHVSAIGFHRVDGDIICIGTENGIFQSSDGGESVVKVLDSGYVTDIAFATDRPAVGYASCHSAYDAKDGVVYKSTDNGKSWWQVSVNLPDSLRILKIVVDPTDADRLYVLTGADRFACGSADVYKSTDGGKHWVNLTADLPEILDLALAPNDPGTVYVATMHARCDAQWYWTDLEGQLYKSTDGGQHWGDPLSDYTGILWLDPERPEVIKLIDPREPYPWNSRSGTFTSTDGGRTFVQTGSVLQWDTFFNGDAYWCYGANFHGICKTIGRDLSDPYTLYWATSQWVFRSSNGGDVFTNIFTDEVKPGFWRSRGLDNVNVMDIAISDADPAIVYVGYFDMGIWRSLDGGASWQSCNDTIYTGNWEGFGGNCATILADPDRPNVVWASQSENQAGEAPTYLLKNEHTGERGKWVLSNAGLPNAQIMGLSMDVQSPMHRRTLYVTAQRDVYKSADDGAHWQKVFECDGCRFTAVDFFDGNIVYAGGEKGVWRSIDGGLHWVDVSHPEMIGNGTDFWDWNYQGVFDVKTDPNNPCWVYVAVFGPGKGLYRSTDCGDTWTKVLVDHFLRKVAVVPANSGILYATSSSAFDAGGYNPASNGVWYSADGGRTWIRQNQGMAYPFALAIDVDHTSTPTVFVGAPGTGVQKAAVPLPSAVKRDTPAIDIRFFRDQQIGWILGECRNVNLQIFDLRGKVVFRIENLPCNTPFKLPALSGGVYFLSLQLPSSGHRSLQRIVWR